MENTAKIKFEEFLEYVQGLRDANHPCQYCGENQWNLMSTLETNLYNAPAILSYALPFGTISPKGMDKSGDVMLNSALPILFRECNSCGNMIFFNYATVLKKINAKAAKPSPEGNVDND